MIFLGMNLWNSESFRDGISFSRSQSKLPEAWGVKLFSPCFNEKREKERRGRGRERHKGEETNPNTEKVCFAFRDLESFNLQRSAFFFSLCIFFSSFFWLEYLKWNYVQMFDSETNAFPYSCLICSIRLKLRIELIPRPHCRTLWHRVCTITNSLFLGFLLFQMNVAVNSVNSCIG